MGFDMSMFTDVAKSTFEGLMTFLVYGLPFIAMLMLLAVIFFVLKRRKVYAIDCIVYTLSNNNLVEGMDKGGIVKNALGVEEFRFQKRKKSCPVPNRKFWVIKDNGKYCIHFYRHSDDDFDPVEIKPKKDGGVPVPVPVPGLKQRIVSKLNPAFKEDKNIKPIDVKEQFKGVDFVPVKSETKQFLMMKAKEIVYKNKIKKSLEKWTPMIMWGGLIIAFIFLVIWYFKYAGVLADRQLNCLDPGMVKNLIGEVCGKGGAGYQSPF